MMSRVLFIFENDIPTVSIMKDVFSHLTETKNIIFEFVYLSEVSAGLIDVNDIIIFIRPTNVFSWKIASNAGKAGHLVVTFCDDDLLNLPKTLASIPWRRRGLIKTLKNSDVIWSSSEYILEKYKNYTKGKRVAHIDTIIHEEELEGIETAHNNETIKIVYAAGKSHSKLFEKYIKPIVPNLKNKYRKDISFTFVGVHPDMGDIACEYVTEMSLLEYRKYMRESKFDIGLAPLHDDEFSKCKYFNKFVEYTTQGIVGVYTDVEPYTYVVKNSETGFLTKNEPTSWMSALCEAIENKEQREQCVKSAINYLRQKHSEKIIVERMLSEIPEMKSHKREYRKCKGFGFQKFVYWMSRPFDWLYLTFFYLRHNGIDDVIHRAGRRLKGMNMYGGRNGR